jgi:hypothetical protein
MQRSFLAGTLLLTLLCLPLNLAWAGSITATLSSAEIHVGEAATLEVQIVGSIVGKPRIKSVPVASLHAVGQHNQTTIQRGRASQVHTFTYRVAGLVPGKATLGPAKIDIDGRELRSEYFAIEVLPRRQRTNRTRSGPGQAAGRPSGRVQLGSAPQKSVAEDYYATATVTDETPWAGQSILYKVEVGSSVPPRDIEWEPPGFSPLSTEPNLQLSQEDQQKIIEGQRYTVNTITVPVFAIEAGPVELDAAQFVMTLVRSRGFFGSSEQVPFRSNKVALAVRPLPKVGRPDGFGGAVGNYQVKASLDRSQLDAGETATLTVEVTGRGALRGEVLRVAVPDSIRSYEEQPEIVSVLRGEVVHSRAVYRSTLVPLEPGRFDLPQVAFTFFDPAAGAYRTTLTEPLTLEVGGVPVTDPVVIARSASLGRAKDEVEILGVDILPLHSSSRLTTNQHLSPTAPWLLILLGVPFLGLLGAATAARQLRLQGTPVGEERRRRTAGKAASRDATKAATEDDSDAATTALRAYLVARLGPAGAALGDTEAAEVLQSNGANAEVAELLTRLLGRIERVRYGGGVTDGLSDEIARWIKQSERDWR